MKVGRYVLSRVFGASEALIFTEPGNTRKPHRPIFQLTPKHMKLKGEIPVSDDKNDLLLYEQKDSESDQETALAALQEQLSAALSHISTPSADKEFVMLEVKIRLNTQPSP